MWRSWGVVPGSKGRDEKGYACGELDLHAWEDQHTYGATEQALHMKPLGWPSPGIYIERTTAVKGDICLAMNTLNLSSTVLSEVAITKHVSTLTERLSLCDLRVFILSLIVSHLLAMIGPRTP